MSEKTAILEITRFVAVALGELGEILTNGAKELHSIVEETLIKDEDAETVISEDNIVEENLPD